MFSRITTKKNTQLTTALGIFCVIVLCVTSCDKHRVVKRIQYPDGSYYIGEVKANMRDGKGVSFDTNGTIEIGEWKHGHLNGRGCYIYNTTTSTLWYAGDFLDGIKRGKGTLSKDGDIYHGSFVLGGNDPSGIMIISNQVTIGVSLIDFLKVKGLWPRKTTALTNHIPTPKY